MQQTKVDAINTQTMDIRGFFCNLHKTKDHKTLAGQIVSNVTTKITQRDALQPFHHISPFKKKQIHGNQLSVSVVIN